MAICSCTLTVHVVIHFLFILILFVYSLMRLNFEKTDRARKVLSRFLFKLALISCRKCKKKKPYLIEYFWHSESRLKRKSPSIYIQGWNFYQKSTACWKSPMWEVFGDENWLSSLKLKNRKTWQLFKTGLFCFDNPTLWASKYLPSGFGHVNRSDEGARNFTENSRNLH